MSVWRQKAIEIVPECRNDFQAPGLSPYTVFTELLGLLEEAHFNNDNKRIQQIYQYAAWCFHEKDQQLWNAAGVSFYEHLGENETVFSQFTKWISKEIYVEIRGLLVQRLHEQKIALLDRHYGGEIVKKK